MEEQVKNEQIVQEENIEKDIENKETEGSEKTIVEKVEMNRDVLYTYFRKQKNINKILFIISLVAIVGVYIIFAQQFELALVISVVILLAVFGYTFMAKRKLTAMTNIYIKVYFGLMSDYIFAEKSFQDIANDYQGKIEKEEIAKSRVIKDIYSAGNRNVTKGLIDGYPFTSCDTAIKIQMDNKPVLAFIGKYYVIDSPKEIKGRAIVYIKGKFEGAGPTDIDDLEKIDSFDIKNAVVYGSKDHNLSAFLTRKNIKILNSFSPKGVLTDITFSFVDGKIHVLANYEDSLMVVPMQVEFNDEAFKQARSDALKIEQIISNLK